MKKVHKSVRADKVIQIVLMVSAVLLVIALFYTLFFRFSVLNLFLVLLLMACVGVCLPGYLPKNTKKRQG